MPNNSVPWEINLGTTHLEGDRVSFRVWAPKVQQPAVMILDAAAPRIVSLEQDEKGFYTATVAGISAGTRYLLYLFADGSQRPDPASLFQPKGVRGPSQVVNPAGFAWDDEWKGMPLDMTISIEG